jgi:hypothetical protein
MCGIPVGWNASRHDQSTKSSLGEWVYLPMLREDRIQALLFVQAALSCKLIDSTHDQLYEGLLGGTWLLLTGFMCSASFSLLSSRISLSILSIPRSFKARCRLFRLAVWTRRPGTDRETLLILLEDGFALVGSCSASQELFMGSVMRSRYSLAREAYFRCTISGSSCRNACAQINRVPCCGLGHCSAHSLTSLHSGAKDADILLWSCRVENAGGTKELIFGVGRSARR